MPDAEPGDDVINAFIGDKGLGASADEATLDIQFIMGVRSTPPPRPASCGRSPSPHPPAAASARSGGAGDQD